MGILLHALFTRIREIPSPARPTALGETALLGTEFPEEIDQGFFHHSECRPASGLTVLDQASFCRVTSSLLPWTCLSALDSPRTLHS